MTTRQELLDQWQDRLLAAEAACDDPAVDCWTARLRRKLYRFLLAMYRQSPWPGPKDDVDNEAGRALHSQLVIAEPKEAFAGKEPRTRAQILKGLSNVKGLSDELAPPGPLIAGLKSDSPVVVAAFKKRYPAECALRRLRRLGFRPQMVRNAELFQIFVIANQAAAAIYQLENEAVATPVASRPSKYFYISARHKLALVSLAAIWCTGLAVLCTYVFVNYAWNHEPSPGLLEVSALAVVILDLLSAALLWSWWKACTAVDKPASKLDS